MTRHVRRNLGRVSGLISALKGAKTAAGAVRARERRVGVSAERVREALDEAGERGGGLMIRCPDQTTAEAVEARAAERATDHWKGSRIKFLAALDRFGSEYDWLRPAAGSA